ncbi:hypothetical protein K438DRAFT_1990310 [Mycena galopus ATCC 62051]|nr:hypothetical protein K438DRAFT_1990310 [Mycena galopus ATCC 62051]
MESKWATFRGYPLLCEWIRAIYRASLVLGVKPTPFKANVATPIHKAGKKDKTSPKAWCPVENYEHILAKPLEGLVTNRISFDAESLGLLQDAQHGGRPGHSTLQAIDGYIHRVKEQSSKSPSQNVIVNKAAWDRGHSRTASVPHNAIT